MSFPLRLDFMQSDCYSFEIMLLVTFLGCNAHKGSQFKHCQDIPKKYLALNSCHFVSRGVLAPTQATNSRQLQHNTGIKCLKEKPFLDAMTVI